MFAETAAQKTHLARQSGSGAFFIWNDLRQKYLRIYSAVFSGVRYPCSRILCTVSS